MSGRSKPTQQNAQAQVEQAQLKLTYTKIVAPVAGIVMKRSAEVGDHIAAGQQLLVIAQMGELWVTANFKETQLRRIQPGQPARIHVDAMNQDFDGYVENVGGGTGAINSVLPPENATGNYVKVVQRIPVRLRFKPIRQGLTACAPACRLSRKCAWEVTARGGATGPNSPRLEAVPQPVRGRADGDAGHFHGGAGYFHRQRFSAPHRRLARRNL